tara:strand:+ start:5933 stop:6127 length:195 start_codon:yes stop_codon:yes gene_type:complete
VGNVLIKVNTTDEQFDLLHQAVDKARKNAKEVKVARKALLNLLMDHSKFTNTLKQHGETIEVIE